MNQYDVLWALGVAIGVVSVLVVGAATADTPHHVLVVAGLVAAYLGGIAAAIGAVAGVVP